jgi:UDP-glucose 4-epimerase
MEFMESILVTGGAGSLGKYVCAELEKAGHRVVIFDLKAGKDKQISFIEGSIGSREDLDMAMNGITAVVHLAAIPYDIGDPQKIFDTNVNGTLNVIESSVKHKVKKILFASSISVAVHINWQPPYIWAEKYRPFDPEFLPLTEEHPCRPGDIYGTSKLCGENLLMAFCKLHKISGISFRIAPVWFPEKNERMERVVRSILDEKLAIDRVWSYVDVRDVAAAFKLGIAKNVEGYSAYNIGANEIIGNFKTLEMIQRYYPHVKKINRQNEFLEKYNYPIWDISKAKADLCFNPKYSWKDYHELFRPERQK